jgi:prepilin-type N-terminal cleavage/methylation domain-containing protein/prepilin-type processing-associated H-X9-DG protein
MGLRALVRNQGFTLIELLTTLAIIGVLIAATLPAVQFARESARRTNCANRLKQIALGLSNFEAGKKSFPAGIRPPFIGKWESSTWLLHVLPHIELQAVYDQAEVDYDVMPSPFLGHRGFITGIQNFVCPSSNTSVEYVSSHGYAVTLTDYLGVNGTNYRARDGVFYMDSRTRARDIRDGLSNTLLIGERPPSPDFWYGWWYAGYGNGASGSPDMLLGVREINDPPGTYLESCPPGPYAFGPGRDTEQCDALHFWSHHPGGAQFALCDGSVHFFSHGADSVFPQLATIRGAEVVTLPE